MDETELPPEPDQPHGPAWQPPPSTWSDPSRRYTRSMDEHGLPPMPPVHPPRKTGKRVSIGIAIIAIVGIGVLIGLLESSGGKKTTPTANASPVGASSVLTLGATVTATSSSLALPSDPIAPATTPASKAAGAPPATITVHVTPAPPHVSTKASLLCHPDRPILDTCYLVGETCPVTDHGVRGVSIDGQPMICAQENEIWLWRAS
jgi:hypothetical protein